MRSSTLVGLLVALALGEEEVRRVVNCSCVRGHNVRLYHFDTRGEMKAGFNHQTSNLKSVLLEGLSLGRAVVLKSPSLTLKHNYEKPFQFARWSDYVDFESSKFFLRIRKTKKLVCEGTIASCIRDVSDDFLRKWRNSSQEVRYRSGRVPAEKNNENGLLVRAPGPKSKDGKRDRVSLTRKLPGFADIMAEFQLTLKLKPSSVIASAVPPVIARLRAQSQTGDVAVVHARRGDKIMLDRYCPLEMQQATSPQHIASVLKTNGVEPGSSIYLMTNDHTPHYFEPLRDAGYHFTTSTNYDHLHNLLKGCFTDNNTTKEKNSDYCENYLLFAIENEIMRAVPVNRRFPTLPKKDMPTSKHFLMKDFLGKQDSDCKL